MARVSSLSTVAAALIFLACVPAAGAGNPTSLILPQGTAFALLGASCGGIQEQAFATGFDSVTGDPTGDVYLQTRCGGSGRGGGYKVHTYSAWAAVTWTLAGTVSSYARLAGAPANLDPTFSATDAFGDRLYNLLRAAYLEVVVPAAPTGVTAAQVGDQLQVDWALDPATAPLVTSSTATATPIASSAPVLSATVSGAATSALLGPLQPETTYEVTVVSTDAGGTSQPGDSVTVSTPASTVVPSAPTGVSASWTAPLAPGDVLSVAWDATVPGDSPIDAYQVAVTGSDGSAGSFTQTVSGSTLGAGFVVDDTLSWTIQVQAHDAAGWGPWSDPIVIDAADG